MNKRFASFSLLSNYIKSEVLEEIRGETSELPTLFAQKSEVLEEIRGETSEPYIFVFTI